MSETVNYELMRKQLIDEKDVLIEKIRRTKTMVRDAPPRVKQKLKQEHGRMIKKMEDIQAQLTWVNSQLRNGKSLSDYFLIVARQDLDKETFEYMMTRAKLMHEKGIGV